MADRDHLHDEIDRLLASPDSYRSRSRTRVLQRALAHALVDLGYVNEIVCAYADCVYPSREFTEEVLAGNSLSLDHIVRRSAGGSDRPDNYQLMHLRCNAVKGQREACEDPAVIERIRSASTDRWKDPQYRQRVSQAVRDGNNRPEVVARKSAAMKARWADPAHRAARAANRKPRVPAECHLCGQICASPQGLGLHLRNSHSSSTAV